MAEAVSSLLNDENLRTELGIVARNTIEEKFTWDAISNKILRCYYSICKEPVII